MGFGSFPAYDKLPYEKRIPGKEIVKKMVFLSDPSPIIGNACQWLTHSLTDSLTAV